MAVSLSTIAAKDSAGTAIAGGLQAQDKSGAGTGPFTLGQVLIDGVAGTNMAQVTAANALKVDGSAVTATANGSTQSRINSAGSTNATSLKASAGQLYTIDVFNAAAYNVFLKLYNKASAPTVGTDTPVMTIPIAAGGGYSKTWPMGFPFGTGIAYAITKLQADSDTTAVLSGDLTGNTLWI